MVALLLRDLVCVLCIGDGAPESRLVELARYTIYDYMIMIVPKFYLWWIGGMNSHVLERAVFKRINGWTRGRGAIRY
jgi:hypothetical protein